MDLIECVLEGVCMCVCVLEAFSLGCWSRGGHSKDAQTKLSPLFLNGD